MSFLDADMLWWLLAIPLLAYGYVRLVRAREAQRAALGTMAVPAGRKPLRWRRHASVVLFLVALTVLVVAAARPVATLDLPRREGTVILAFDVSASMTADDLEPDRLRAAQRAALRFLDRQPESIKVGVVAFSTAAFEVAPPTEDRAEIRDAIRRLEPVGATSLAGGIAASVNAIAGRPVVTGFDNVLPPSGGVDEAPPETTSDVPFLGASAVILLSDGEDTTDVDPVSAANVASRAGIRIVTVGIGTPEGTVIDVGGFQVATRLDEQVLQAVAAAANGEYFHAEDAGTLADVYEAVDLKFTIEPEKTEITALLAAVALGILLVAAVLSYRWLGRVP